MSSSDSTIEEVRAQGSVDRRHLMGLVRRVALKLTSGPFWQAVGVLLIDRTTKETIRAEVFSGIGFASRPHPGSNAEAIAVHEGGAENPYFIATRDEDLRKKVFPANAPMQQDETAMFNTQVVSHITKAGKLLVHLLGQAASAVGLAKASELNDLRAFVVQQFSSPGHTHTVSGAATTAVVPVVLPVVLPVATYPGTSVLKGQ